MALLIGDATATYSVADTVNSLQINAWLFTAAATGTVDTLQFRTGATANTGVTSVILGIYADNGSGTTPTTAAGALGQGTFSGTPAINTWIVVSGLSIPVVSGTKYWLAALPQGAALNYNDAVASAGTNVAVSTSSSETTLATETWSGPFAVGPAGFQGLSTVAAAASPVGRAFLPLMAPQGGL